MKSLLLWWAGFTVIVIATATLLLLLSGARRPAQAQSVGVSVATYYTEGGGHPFFHFAGTLRAETAPGIGVEFLHAALREHLGTSRQPLDLFSYRVTYRQELLTGDTRPFILLGAGMSHWRKWRPQDPVGPLFGHTRQLGLTAGVGVKSKMPGNFSQRIDLRLEHTARGGTDFWFAFGMDLTL